MKPAVDLTCRRYRDEVLNDRFVLSNALRQLLAGWLCERMHLAAEIFTDADACVRFEAGNYLLSTIGG